MSQQDPPEADQPVLPKPKKVKYPLEIQFAGFAWLFVAAVQLFGVVVLFVNLDTVVPTRPTQPAPVQPRFDPRTGQPLPPALPPAEPPSVKVVLYVVTAVAVVIALVFGITGLQALSGGAKSFMGAGVASIFLGLLAAASGVAQVVHSGNGVALAASGLSALAALTGGAAAVGGSKKYQAWRTFQKAKTKGRRVPGDLPRAAWVNRPPAPLLSKLAGTCWLLAVVALLGTVVVGTLTLSDLKVSTRPAAQYQTSEAADLAFVSAVAGLGLASLFVVALSICGLRAVSGSASGFTLSGIGTSALGLLFAGFAGLWWSLWPGLLVPTWALAASLTLLGGVLALVARAPYSRWRERVRRLKEAEGEGELVPLENPTSRAARLPHYPSQGDQPPNADYPAP